MFDIVENCKQMQIQLMLPQTRCGCTEQFKTMVTRRLIIFCDDYDM